MKDLEHVFQVFEIFFFWKSFFEAHLFSSLFLGLSATHMYQCAVPVCEDLLAKQTWWVTHLSMIVVAKIYRFVNEVPQLF